MLSDFSEIIQVISNRAWLERRFDSEQRQLLLLQKRMALFLIGSVKVFGGGSTIYWSLVIQQFRQNILKLVFSFIYLVWISSLSWWNWFMHLKECVDSYIRSFCKNNCSHKWSGSLWPTIVVVVVLLLLPLLIVLKIEVLIQTY